MTKGRVRGAVQRGAVRWLSSGGERCGGVRLTDGGEPLGKGPFKDLATATWRSAVDLYGADSTEAGAVRGAWDAVLLLDGDDALFTTP